MSRLNSFKRADLDLDPIQWGVEELEWAVGGFFPCFRNLKNGRRGRRDFFFDEDDDDDDNDDGVLLAFVVVVVFVVVVDEVEEGGVDDTAMGIGAEA